MPCFLPACNNPPLILCPPAHTCISPLHSVIRTGGSLIGAAQAYKAAGASRISVVSTHGVFAGDAIAKLQGCGLFERVAVTDSHPAARRAEGAFVKVHTIVPLLADFIRSQ